MLCNIAKEIDEYVYDWLHRQPEVKEESITDWMLDSFDRKSNKIKYYQFSRHEEGKESGADWDWWILLESGCLKLRIQAKKIKKGTDHYAQLARSNKNNTQIDILINSSRSKNFYPLYSLYGKTEAVSRCPESNTKRALSICSATEVYNLVFGSPRQKIDSTDLLKLTIPLECLFCCPLSRSNRKKGIHDLFKKYFNDKSDDQNSTYLGHEKEIPELIYDLYHAENINENNKNTIKKYRTEFSGSNGIGIIDLRE